MKSHTQHHRPCILMVASVTGLAQSQWGTGTNRPQLLVGSGKVTLQRTLRDGGSATAPVSTWSTTPVSGCLLWLGRRLCLQT